MQQILFLRPGAWRPALLTQQARGWLLVLLTLLAGATSALAQPTYCNGTSLGGFNNGSITSVSIASTPFSNSTFSTPPAGSYYTSYPASVTTATLQPGATYSFTVNLSSTYSAVLWIDYNQNGVFDTSEGLQVLSTTTGGTTGTISFTVPTTATPGQTGLRIRTRLTANPNDPSTSCLSYGSGETQDYVVTISSGAPCTTPPTPGTASASPANVCPGGTTTLTLTGASFGAGLTYQWQSSTTSATTGFTNISGATSSSYTTPVLTQTTYYRAVLTCSGQSATSNVVTVGQSPFLNCYCTPTYTFGGGTDGITNVTLGTLNSASSATNTAPYYTDYASQQTGTSPTLQIPVLIPGSTSNISVTVGSNGSQYVGVWVDFNQNGQFETTEYFSLGTSAGANGTAIIPIVVPTGAVTGQTKLRVRGGEDVVLTSAQACGASSSGFGEAEDYLVNVAATVACTGTPPTITATGPANACPATSYTLTASGPVPGTSGLTYQWQSSPTPTGTFTNVGTASASNMYTVASQTAATSYRVVVTCTASGQSSTSNVVTVAVSPFLNCYCTPTYSLGGTFDNITNVTLGTLNSSSSTTNAAPYYTNYAPQQTGTSPTLQIPILIPGTTSNVSITVGADGSQYSAVWVDFNQNGQFETTEYFSTGANAGASGTVIIPIVVPNGAITGQTKLRVRAGEDGSAPTSAQACGASSSGYGEAEDYLVNVAATVACTGTPPTITATGPANACPATSYTLTASGPVPGTSGLTYQWQSSPTPTGTFTNVGTASASNMYTVASQTAATSYRVVVTCTASGQSSTSNVVTVAVSPFLNCYCTPTYTTGGTFDGIVRVVLNTLDNPSSTTNTTPYYTDYAPQQTGTSPTLAIPGLSPGIPSNVSVTVGSDGNQYVGVWIDFNQNGQFETTEYFSLGTNAGSSGTSVIPVAVPANAILGQTKMRVRGGEDVVQTSAQACGASSSGYGEAEDYLVNVVPCTGGSPAAAAFSYGTAASYCQSGTTNPVVVQGTGASKGVFSSTAGLTLNATTGTVTLSTSTPGTYTVTNTIVAGGTQCASVNTTTITITAPPTATFSYPATPLTCANTVGTITPVLTGGATAGTFSLPTAPGLTINPTTGVVTVGTAAASGTYTVTNSIPSLNGCAPVTSTATFLLSLPPTSTFNYGAGTFCQNGLDPTPLITGTTGGTFTVSPATGLVLNSATGTISLFTSRGGTYTVTYTITTPCGVSSSTQTVSVTTQPTAGFTYLTGTSTGVGCAGSNTTVAPILLNGGVIGTFSVIPATGLTINASTGVISLATSAIGVYTVTNTIAATAGCGVSLNTSVFTVIAAPTTPTLTATANPQGGILLTASAATGVTYQFYLNGQPVSGATGQTYVVNSGTLNGTYTVTTTNAGGCSATSAAVPVAVTASASAQAGTSLTVYPNPTRDGLLTLELSGYREAVSWSLTNVLGQRLLEGTVSGNALTQKQALNLSALPTGVYLLQARTASGGLETRRIVRE